LKKHPWIWSFSLLFGSITWSADEATCNDRLVAALHECERIVGSLRADKAGQKRLFAPDGSEFTAEQGAWLRDQLNLILEECAGGNSGDAARRLAEVQELLRRSARLR